MNNKNLATQFFSATGGAYTRTHIHTTPSLPASVSPSSRAATLDDCFLALFVHFTHAGACMSVGFPFMNFMGYIQALHAVASAHTLDS